MRSKLRLMLTVKSSLLTLCWNCKCINKRNGCSFHIREPISRLMNKISVEAITKLFYVVSRLSMRSFCPIYNYDLYIVKLDGNRVNIMPSSSNWYLIINGFVLATHSCQKEIILRTQLRYFWVLTDQHGFSLIPPWMNNRMRNKNVEWN